MRMKQSTLSRAAVALGTILLLGALLGCGGGGGGVSPPPTLSGEIKGLAPGVKLILSVNGQAQEFSTPQYAQQPALNFTRSFFSGETYAIDVVKHPAGQICAVLRARTGVLTTSVSNVLVECHTTRLNDTGIRGSTAQQTSAWAPDSSGGRDAEADRLTKVGSGAFGFDYSKVCSSGVLVDSAGQCPGTQTWDCVRDNVTGLMWRRVDVPYAGAPPVATEPFCGDQNWRLPTVHELLSIVHAGKDASPYLDTDFFTATQPATPFLTSETYRDGAGAPWAVDFNNGGAASKLVVGSASRARWVSGTSDLNDPEPIPSAYSTTDANANYVIVDTQRELMWLVPKALVQSDWAGAQTELSSVNGASLGGYGDWRVPNRSELDALANRNFKTPAMDPKVRDAIANADAASVVYWSSSPWVRDTGRAWVVDFAYGDISTKSKTESARLIFVRNRAFNAPQ
ncbi:MAG: DUF1566 domain-containing protein [Rubrivivax sp.]|jgi:hypothetical protein|nr:DUF1566 domain-containing protein [Rubrivivax sp.]